MFFPDHHDVQPCVDIMNTELGYVTCSTELQVNTALSATMRRGVAVKAEIVGLRVDDCGIVHKLKWDHLAPANLSSLVVIEQDRAVGVVPFDSNRPPSLSELEDAICSALRIDALTVNLAISWVVRGPGAATTPLQLHGSADLASLTLDVRTFGHSGVSMIIHRQPRALPSSRPVPGLKSTRPTSAAAAESRVTPRTTTSPQKLTPRRASAAATRTSTTGGPRKAIARAAATDNFDGVRGDTDTDYVSIAYSLNPPEIDVIGYLDPQILSLLETKILSSCLSAHMIQRTNPKFEDGAVVGTFPVKKLNLRHSYFTLPQEMALLCAIFDTMEEAGGFRVVPMDGSTFTEMTLMQQSKTASRAILNLASAAAASPDATAVGKIHYQLLFIPL